MSDKVSRAWEEYLRSDEYVSNINGESDRALFVAGWNSRGQAAASPLPPFEEMWGKQLPLLDHLTADQIALGKTIAFGLYGNIAARAAPEVPCPEPQKQKPLVCGREECEQCEDCK